MKIETRVTVDAKLAREAVVHHLRVLVENWCKNAQRFLHWCALANRQLKCEQPCTRPVWPRILFTPWPRIKAPCAIESIPWTHFIRHLVLYSGRFVRARDWAHVINVRENIRCEGAWTDYTKILVDLICPVDFVTSLDFAYFFSRAVHFRVKLKARNHLCSTRVHSTSLQHAFMSINWHE